MDNKKVSNLLRAVADLMDQTTEVVVETNKEISKTVEKVQEDGLNYALKLIKRIDENDAIRSYKNKMTGTNKKLSEALEEIQKMREKAVSDMIKESKNIKSPTDTLFQILKNSQKIGEQFVEESNIIKEAVKG